MHWVSCWYLPLATGRRKLLGARSGFGVVPVMVVGIEDLFAVLLVTELPVGGIPSCPLVAAAAEQGMEQRELDWQDHKRRRHYRTEPMMGLPPVCYQSRIMLRMLGVEEELRKIQTNHCLH